LWNFWGFIFNYLPFFCKIKFFFIFWGFICNYLPLFVKSNVFFDIKKIKIRFLIVNLNSKIFAENVLFGTPYGNQLFLWKKSKKVEKNQKNTKKTWLSSGVPKSTFSAKIQGLEFTLESCVFIFKKFIFLFLHSFMDHEKHTKTHFLKNTLDRRRQKNICEWFFLITYRRKKTKIIQKNTFFKNTVAGRCSTTGRTWNELVL